MLDVILPTHSLEMGLWIPCYNNAEEVSIFLSDELNKLCGISEAIFDWCPIFNTMWWISSKGKDVPDTVFFGLVKGFDNLFSSHTSASQMHEDIDS